MFYYLHEFEYKYLFNSRLKRFKEIQNKTFYYFKHNILVTSGLSAATLIGLDGQTGIK